MFTLVFGLQFEGIVSKNIYLKTIAELRSELKTLVPSDSRVIYKGRAEDLLEYTSMRMSEAKLVKNTVVLVSKEKAEIDNPSTKINDELASWVDNVVNKRRGWWYDVVSSSCVSRISAVRDKVGATHRYDARVIIPELPIVNFMIIHNENGDRELLFGFGLNDHDMNGYVFSTSDIKIVDTFENYFNAINAFGAPASGHSLVVSKN